MKEDGLDHFRKEYNQMLLSKVTGASNSIIRERILTVTVAKRNIEEARAYFSRVGTDLHHPPFPAVLCGTGAGFISATGALPRVLQRRGTSRLSL